MDTVKTTGIATRQTEVYYPESDGKPMAETDLHRDEMFELIGLLKARYADAPDVYVSGNLLLYYEEGNPRAAVAPDCFVVFGVAAGRRRIYRLWVERIPPTVVIEVSSRKTRREDLRTKMTLYAALGVEEYFLYDPEADYLRPALQGHRLADTGYVPLVPDATGALRSHRLQADLRLVDGWLQLYNIATGARLVRPSEQAEVGAHAVARAERAEARAEDAEAELARLRAELECLRDGGDAGG